MKYCKKIAVDIGMSERVYSELHALTYRSSIFGHKSTNRIINYQLNSRLFRISRADYKC